MKDDGIDSLSPIKLTPIYQNKRKEFRKKDVISKLDPRYLKYENLILEGIRRRKSNTEKKALELNNYINNKLMKASLLREKFYQKRKLNLKEKHDRITNVYMKRKKALNTFAENNNILKSKKMLAKLAKKRSIDYTCIKESLFSSDSSAFSSSESVLSSSTSNIDLNSSSENVGFTDNEPKEDSHVKNDNNNNIKENVIKDEIGKNNKIEDEIIKIEDNNKKKDEIGKNNKNENEIIKIEEDNNMNSKNDSNNNSSNNSKNDCPVVTITIDGKEYEPPKEDMSKNSVKKDISNHSITNSKSNSRKNSNNTERSESQVNKVSSNHHHHKHHHHRNDKNGHNSNKKKLNEISTGRKYVI